MKKCNYARNEIAEYKSDLNICCADCQLEARKGGGGCDDKEKTVDETSKYLVVGPLQRERE